MLNLFSGCQNTSRIFWDDRLKHNVMFVALNNGLDVTYIFNSLDD